MIRHIVLFKLLDGLRPDDPLVVTTFDRLAALSDTIPEIRSWRVGPNVKAGARAYDFALVGDYDDLEALAGYVDHPDHQALLPALDQVSTRVTVDLEIPTPADTQ